MDAPLTRRVARAAPLLVEAALLALLVAASVAAVHAHQRLDSPTSDEAIHLFSGSEALEEGTGWLNPEHPPLMKLAGALALRPLALRPPCGGTGCPTSPLPGYPAWLYGNRAPAHAVVAAGRRPFPWVLALLVVVLHVAVRPLAGRVAGLLAAGVVALDPTFVAHAAYVHTDVGAAVGFLAVTVLAARAATGTGLGRWLAVGLALGVALVTKFSALLLVPAVAVSPLLPLLFRTGAAARPRGGVTRDRVVGAVVALGLAALVVQGVYAWTLRRMTPERDEASIRAYLESRPSRPDEVERYGTLARLLPPLGTFLGGAKGVALLSERGRGANYFLGRVSDRGFPLYFPAAFLLKATPAFLALLAAALALGLSRLRRGGVPERAASAPALAALLAATLATGLLAASMRSAFNIGVRHLLPAWALLAFAAAVVAGRALGGRPRLRGMAACALVVSTGLSLASAGASPIAYFNVFAGGEDGGRRSFSDSNVDWGQDLYRLHLFLAGRGWEETTTIVAWGGIATNYYSRGCRLLDPAVPVGPGRYAVSHMMETLGPELVRPIEGEAAARQVEELVRALHSRGRRIALVGGSITVWDLPG